MAAFNFSGLWGKGLESVRDIFTALFSVTSGHDHDGVNSKLVAVEADVKVGTLASLTTTVKTNAVAAINEVDAHADSAAAAAAAVAAALPNYLLAVAPGQKELRNTQTVTGSMTVDLSASFASIDEVVVCLGAAPTDEAISAAVVIPDQAVTENKGKFTIHIAKLDVGSAGVSTTPTVVHYRGMGTPVAA